MIDERVLHRLKQRPIELPPVEEVCRRGNALRRRRTLGRALVVAAAVGLVGAGLVWRADDRSGMTDTAGVPGAGLQPAICDGGTAAAVPASEVDLPLLIPTWLPGGTDRLQAFARTSKGAGTCTQIPTSLAAISTTPAGAITAAVRVEGPATAGFRPDEGKPARTTTLRSDTEGLIVSGYEEPEFLILQWTEPDGTYWRAITNGLDESDALAFVEGLVLQPAEGRPVADMAAPVAGLKVTWNLDAITEPTRHSAGSWWAFDASIELRLNRTPLGPSSAAMAVHGSQVVEVRGHDAVFVHVSDDHNLLVWDEEPAVTAELKGAYDMATLVRIAESLAPAAPDDPRIED